MQDKELKELIKKYSATNRSGNSLKPNIAAGEMIHDLCKQDLENLMLARRVAKAKASNRNWEKYLQISQKNPAVISYQINGRGLKKKLKIFKVSAGLGKFGKEHRLSEEGLVGCVELYDFRLENEVYSGDALFTVGKHCIQRIIERNSIDTRSYNFSALRSEIFNELTYLALVASVLKNLIVILPIFISDINLDRQKIVEIFLGISIPVPTPNGVLLCDLEGVGSSGKVFLAARTFINRETLGAAQKKFLNKLQRYLSGFEESFLLYFFEDFSVAPEAPSAHIQFDIMQIYIQGFLGLLSTEDFNLAVGLRDEQAVRLKSLNRLLARHAITKSETIIKAFQELDDRKDVEEVINVFVRARKGKL